MCQDRSPLVWSLVGGPSGGVLEAVVGLVQGGEVVQAGGPALAPGGEVVQVAAGW